MSDVSDLRDMLVDILTDDRDDISDVSPIDGEPDVLALNLDGDLYFVKVIPA